MKNLIDDNQLVLEFNNSGPVFDRAKETADAMGLDMQSYLYRMYPSRKSGA